MVGEEGGIVTRGLDTIADELAFLDAAALAVLPSLVTFTCVDSLTQEVSEVRRRAAIAAYNQAAEMLTERRLRHHAMLCPDNKRRA
jgi:hypothetical protein